jgi:hypothetical protein
VQWSTLPKSKAELILEKFSAKVLVMALPLKAQSSSYSPNELLSKNRDIHVRNMINK